MNQIENVVASAVDDNYVWPLLVMLRSARSTESTPFQFILGYDENNLSKNNLNLIETVCGIWKIEMSVVRINLDILVEPGSYITSVTYARLFMADILQTNFIWIDADVLCQKGWDDIFGFGKNTEGDAIVIGSQDPLVQFGVPDSQMNNSAVRLAGTNYFNAGVIYINSLKWKQFNSAEKWRWAYDNASSLGLQFHDQCILNYVLYESSELIPRKYNYLVRNDTGRLEKHPCLIHFAGGFKPWHMPEVALWVISPKSHRDLYRKYGHYQFQVVASIYVSSPRIALLLWKERLKLRQSDTFIRIVRQKKNWFIWAQKIKIYKVVRKMWSIITKFPVMKQLWKKHLEEIVNQREIAITRILQHNQDENLMQMSQIRQERPIEIRSLEANSFGTYETFYSKPPTDLALLFDKYGSDKGTLGNPSVKFPWLHHNYADVYSELFHDKRQITRRVFECGIGTNDEAFKSNMTAIATPGGSLRAWRDYFPNAVIYGADIDRKCLFQEDRIKTAHLNQLDSESISGYFALLPKNSFDVMIDDGIHTFEGTTNLLENSFDYLSDTGIYIIEDIDFIELLDYKKYLESKNHRFRIISIKRKEHHIGDNNLILLKK
jgi:lipopolysaccharide biosynthesis glycosyltransferase